MDINRGVLDNLMGRDRNLPRNSIHARDHYSNSDVCKPFLICFCFNTLFPNTIYDEGPCNKRHDTYLKTMFDNDLNRMEFEKVYIKDCIAWIERRIVQAEQKTKKNQNTIDNKSSLSTERPRQILDRILAIDKDIEEMMKKSAIFGQNGQIDDSARCLEEVQRLRQRRKEIDLMGDNLLAVVKQQKICQICGAIQTINDTEKRIQMHLEGKIHQGFLRLRTEIETLKIRLEIVNQKLDKIKQKSQLAIATEKVSAPAVHVETMIEVKPKQNIRAEQQKPDKQKQRDRSHSKKKKKEHKQKKQEKRQSKQKKKRERSIEKRSQQKQKYDRYERSRSRQHHRERDHKKEKKRRDRSQQRQHRRDRSHDHKDKERSRIH